jgi:hypothetical protein
MPVNHGRRRLEPAAPRMGFRRPFQPPAPGRLRIGVVQQIEIKAELATCSKAFFTASTLFSARIEVMPDWQLQSARITLFVTPETEVPSSLWKDLLSELPETSIVQRQTATRTEAGLFADGTLTLLVQPMRVDFAYEGVLALGSGAAPVVGQYPVALRPLMALMRDWISGPRWLPSIIRIALGLVLISPVATREQGYRELERFIDGVPNTPDARDFSYQVNRPRANRVGVDEPDINRLSKWSVGGFRSITLDPAVQRASAHLGSMSHHVRLELDINTSAEYYGTISRDLMNLFLDDLENGAAEIVEHGNRLP